MVTYSTKKGVSLTFYPKNGDFMLGTGIVNFAIVQENIKKRFTRYVLHIQI